MKIKCNTEHCKNYCNNGCKLENIELYFNWDREAYGCYCDNFEESKEYKRSKYLLKQLSEFEYLVIWKDVINKPNKKVIINEIKEKYNPSNKLINIIEDSLIYRYSSRDNERIYSYNVNLNENKIINSSFKFINNKNANYIDINIRKSTCDYIRSLNTDEFGFLKKESVKMINKGINL